MKSRTHFVRIILSGFCLSSLAELAPAATYSVDGRSGSDENPGSADAPLQTIQAGADRAMPGDTVLVAPGVYREWVQPRMSGEPERPITYQSAEPHQAFVRGSELFPGPWQVAPDHPDCFETSLDADWFRKHGNPFEETIRNVRKKDSGNYPAMIFLNGEMLRQARGDGPLQPGEWTVLKDYNILRVLPPAGTSLENAEVEIAVRERIFAPQQRMLGHIAVRGFVFEHAANKFVTAWWAEDEDASTAYPQWGAVGTGTGHHWTIENNIIRYARTLGLDIGAESYWEFEPPFRRLFGADRKTPDDDGFLAPGLRPGWHVIRGNLFSRNGSQAIAGTYHIGVRIEGNIIEETRGEFFHSEDAGIKCHYFKDGVIENNIIRNNKPRGIWIDWEWPNSRISRNVFWNQNPGVYLEMGEGPFLVDHNVFLFDPEAGAAEQHAIVGHDCSGVSIVHNLFGAGINFARFITERTYLRRSDQSEYLAAIRKNHIGHNVFLAGGIKFAEHERCSDNVVAANLFASEQDAREHLDGNSVDSSLHVEFFPATLTATVSMDADPVRLRASPLQDWAPVDWNGHRLPEGEKLRPGPFQDESREWTFCGARPRK